MSRSLTLPCGLTFSGPVALAPLTNLQSHADGTLSDVELNWLRMRAHGGFGWVSTCAAYVSEEGKAWPGQLGIATDAHEAALEPLAMALAEEDTAGVVQLHHAGPLAELAPGLRLGAVDVEGTQRGATEADLRRVVADFVAAARRAEGAGFDGVEIHGANGYLFTHFLSPVENTRTDAYGGDLEGRARLLRETLQAIRAAVSPAFAVGVRISPVDVWGRRGLVLEDSAQLVRWLADDGADFVHLSLADAAAPAPEDPDGPPVARVIRAALPAQVPLFVAGGITTQEDLERARQAGADIGVIGTAAIAHPDWPHVSLHEGWTPLARPWPVDHLRQAGVGEAFLDYLGRFPGMVEGGRPPR